jgi:hypothetical protein
MIQIVNKFVKSAINLNKNVYGFANDWSHIYDGIYKF